MKKILEGYGMVTFIIDIPGKPKWSGTHFEPIDKTNLKAGMVEVQNLPSPCIIGTEPSTRCLVACNLSGSVFETDKSKLTKV